MKQYFIVCEHVLSDTRTCDVFVIDEDYFTEDLKEFMSWYEAHKYRETPIICDSQLSLMYRLIEEGITPVFHNE